MPRRTDVEIARRWPLRLAVTVIVGSAAVPASALALAGGSTGGGGGGSSGGGGGGFSSGGRSSNCSHDCGGGIAAYLIAGLVIALVLGLRYWLKHGGRKGRLRNEERGRAMWRAAAAADAGDGYWNAAALKQRVRECFFPVQLSWENRDVEASRPFVSDALYARHRLQLDGLEKQGRVNRITDLTLGEVSLVNIHNVTDDAEDRFVVRIECSACDWMEDIDSGDLINGSREMSRFEQYWSFARHPEYGWVLDEIQQATEGRYHEQRPVVNEDTG